MLLPSRNFIPHVAVQVMLSERDVVKLHLIKFASETLNNIKIPNVRTDAWLSHCNFSLLL